MTNSCRTRSVRRTRRGVRHDKAYGSRCAALLSLWMLCLFQGPARADDCLTDNAPNQIGYGIYLDQDLLVPVTNEDRDYTMGVGIEVFQDTGPLFVLGDLLEPFEAITGFDQRCGRLFESYLLGAVTYTPDDLSDSAPIFDDRPYASLIYLSNKRVVADDDRALGIELMVGALGLNIAEEVQTALHGWVRGFSDDGEPVDPMGWAHQISDGGEPTARLRFVESRRLVYGDAWDLAGNWDASLGFQTNASIGLSGRAGVLRSPFWSVPYDPINRGNFVPVSYGDELYFWVSGRLRLVAFDALLQGQFRDSAVTVGSDDVRRLVWEAGAGLTTSISGFQLTLSVNAKAGDTRLATVPDDHVWGGVYISRSYQ